MFFPIFFIDLADHCIGYVDLGFDVISHTFNYNLFSVIIPNLFKECKDKFCSDFTKHSIEHFEKHLKEFTSKGVFCIPHLDENASVTEPFLNRQINSIMSSMKSWCCKNGNDGNLKGFVIYGCNLDSYLRFLKFPENVLQNYLYKTSEDSHETVFVYNAVFQVILLIRLAVGENIENEVRLSTNDMMKFTLTFHDVLSKSGVKLINLLVAGEEVNFQSNCESCKHQIFPIKSFSSPKACQRWWTREKHNFGISFFHKNLNEKFSFEFSAKVLGLLTFFQLSREKHCGGGMLPLVSNDSIEQITDIIYLTQDQTKIVYSPSKHLVINGSFGTGKSIAARKKAEIILSRLKPNESLYYMISDSSSLPKGDIPLNPESGIFKVMIESEMATVEQLLKKNSEKKKINLIFDEFCVENLSKVVAARLNHIFQTNEKFRDSEIILISQGLEKDKMETINKRKGNYEIFESFSQSKELSCDLRDTMENNTAQNTGKKIDDTEQQVKRVETESTIRKRKFVKVEAGKHIAEKMEKNMKEENPVKWIKSKYDATKQTVSDTDKSSTTSIFIRDNYETVIKGISHWSSFNLKEKKTKLR